MRNLDRVIQHLRATEDDFFGSFVIRVRAGVAVTITEEHTTKLEESRMGSSDSGRTVATHQLGRQAHADLPGNREHHCEAREDSRGDVEED